MYRFLLRPGWIAGHLVVIVLIGVFLALGFWQLDRLGQRRSEKAVIEARGRQPAVALVELARSSTFLPGPERQRAYRRANVRGTFDTGREVLLEGRSHLGRPGRHVLTPLVVGENSAVLVDRGWVPMRLADPPLAEASPPGGEVALSGVLLPTEPRSRFGPADPPPGPVRRLPRADLKRLASQLPYRLYPLILRLETQKPPNGGPLPQIAPTTGPDEGPHLSYAIQWFSFAAIAAIGYLAFVRRRAGEQLSADPVIQPPQADQAIG